MRSFKLFHVLLNRENKLVQVACVIAYVYNATSSQT